MFIYTFLIQMPRKLPLTQAARKKEVEKSERYVENHRGEEGFVASRKLANAVSIYNYDIIL